MMRMLRFAKVLALGAWIGAIIYFAAVVTRGAFAVLPNRDQAGLLVGFTLGGLHLMGLIAALTFVGRRWQSVNRCARLSNRRC